MRVFRGLGLGILRGVLHAGGQRQNTEIQAHAGPHADRRSIGTRLTARLDVQPDQVLVLGTLHLEAEGLTPAAENDLERHAVPAQVASPVDRHDLVTGSHAGIIGRRRWLDPANHGGHHDHALTIGVHKAAQAEDHVHDHAGRDDGHPRSDALVAVGPGIGRLAGLIRWLFTQHLDEPAQRDGRNNIFRLAAFEAHQRGPEADRKLLDFYPVPFGYQEVAELVDEYDEAQAEHDLED